MAWANSPIAGDTLVVGKDHTGGDRSAVDLAEERGDRPRPNAECLAFDVRGVKKPRGKFCHIGVYESRV